MKKNFKKLSALLLTLVFSMSTMATSFADEVKEPTVTYKGVENENFSFEPGSNYTTTDLFSDFKNVMPGNHLEDQIKIVNGYKGSRALKLYMGAKLHGEPDAEGNVENPISEEVLANLKGDTYEEKLENMHQFLHQLTLTIKTEDAKGNEFTVYEGSPDQLENGFEGSENIFLGKLSKNKSVTLNVTLDVPFEMGNEFAYCIGEVDWIFLIERYNGGGDGPDDPVPDDPDPTDPPSDDPDEEDGEVLGAVDEEEGDVLGEVDEEEKVLGITDSPATGDNTVIMPYIILFAVGLVGMILTAAKKRRKTEE